MPQNDKDKVLAVIFSGQPQAVTFLEGPHHGRYLEYFGGTAAEFGDSSRLTLEPWGYRVFVG